MSFPLTNPDVLCAAILAGGASSRMGREKALIEMDGQPLIARSVALLRPIFPTLAVVTTSPAVEKAAGIAAIADIFPNCGPLAGLHAASAHFQRPFFAVACDMPHLSTDFIRFLGENLGNFDAVVPQSENGIEPLHAVYAPSCGPIFEEILRGGENFSLRGAIGLLNVRWISLEDARSFDANLRFFENWNRPEDVGG